MTIKASGSLSMSEIGDEYQDTGSTSLSEFYGAPGLPSSGAISFADFYGKSDVYTTSFSTTGSTTYATYYNTGYYTYWTAGEDSYSRFTTRGTVRNTSAATTITTSKLTTWSGNPLPYDTVTNGTTITLVSDGVITSGYSSSFVSVQTGTTTLPPSPSENRTWAYKYTLNMVGNCYITGNGQATGAMISGNDRAIYILQNGTQIAAAGSSISTNNVATANNVSVQPNDLIQYDIRDVYWRYSAGGVRAIDCDIKVATWTAG